MAEKGWSWPMMSIKEMVSVCNNLPSSFPRVTDVDFKTPTPVRVREILEGFVVLVWGDDYVVQPKFAAIQATDSAELFDDYWRESAFFRHIYKLMKAASFPDFSIARDVRKPEQKRFVGAISAILNFLRFREDRLTHYTECSLRNQEAQVVYQNAADTLAGLQDERARLAAARQAEEPLIAELEAEIVVLKAQIEQLNRDAAAVTEACRLAKLQVIENGEQLGNLKSDISGIRQDNARLSATIVPDPDRFKRELTNLAFALDKERNATDDVERRGRELKAKTEAMAKLQRESAKLQKLLEETELERNKLKELNRASKEMQANIGKAEQKTHEAEQQQTTLNKQLASMTDKLQRLQKRHAAKREQAAAALEEARAERARFELEAQTTRQKMEQNDATVRMLQHRLQEKQTEFDGEMELVKERFEQLEAQVRDYHRQMQIAMQQPNR